MFLVLFVRLFVCMFVFVRQQVYCKSNKPISLRLDVMIGPINQWKEPINFW